MFVGGRWALRSRVADGDANGKGSFAAQRADCERVQDAGADADDGGDGSEDASPEDGDGSEDEPPSGIRRKTGHGTTGKPGKRLTLEDLQAHFGVSLQARRWSLPA